MSKLDDLATSKGLWVHTYEEGRLDVLEIHSSAEKKGPGSERFIRITGFPLSHMQEMALAILRMIEAPRTGKKPA